MKYLLSTILLLITPLATLHATVVVLNATAGGGGAENSAGTKYTDNEATFQTGFFTQDGTPTGTLLTHGEITALGANPTALDARFVELGTSQSFSAGGDGLFGASFEIADVPADATGSLALSAAQYDAIFAAGATMFAYIVSDTEVGVWDSGTGVLDPGTVSAFNFSFTPNFNGNNVTTLVGSIGSGVFFGASLRTTPIIQSPSCAAPQLTIARNGENIEISWTSDSGCSYQLQTSTTMASWTNLGDSVSGDGTTKTATIPLANAAAFFRAFVTGS